MELNVKTKYEIGDVLYRIVENNIRKFKVVSWSVICKRSKNKKTFKYETTTEVIYGLNVLHDNGAFYAWLDNTEDELDLHYFKSKEELVDNMLKNCNV